MQKSTKPLAERMRPKRLEEFVGQEHLTSPNSVLHIALKRNRLPSMILWGPPGVGKTTLAGIIAEESEHDFQALSAIHSGVKDVREVIEKASKRNLFDNKKPILFIDEIHRFNKAQQDSLLAAVEKGTVTLIGATTENPSFEVNSALLSRCQVFVLKSHTNESLKQLISNALKKDEWLASLKIQVKETDALIAYSSGDARKLLNLLESVAQHAQHNGTQNISNELVKTVAKDNPLLYDKGGDMHYDVISAFIKSIRGSAPDAALYWLARMIKAGEDPKFIARRLVILASEDIGLANPTALVIASNTFQAVTQVGYPECDLILSQCVLYLSTSAKSNSAYTAIHKAYKAVEKAPNAPVPLHLRNAPTQLMKDLEFGKEYKYPHDYPKNYVHQPYLPEELNNEKFYEPGNNARENQIKEYLNKLRNQ